MLVRTLMIIIGSISTTALLFVALIWGGTFFENIDLSNISSVNPIDSIAEHAERVAKKVNEWMKGAAMRLIDADKLNIDFYDEFETADDEYAYAYVSEYQIDTAPSIDIVRCQDCKHWVYNFNGCSRNPCTEPWYAEDFCSYGEREGE